MSIKWAQPVFEQNGPFCYVRAHKDHVTLGFWRRRAITSAKGMLESAGKKMGHIKIRKQDDIQATLVQRWVREAVGLDRKLANPGMGR